MKTTQDLDLHLLGTKSWPTFYIGKKWRAKGRGPTEFDCWGLVWHHYKTVLGIELPLFLIDPSNYVDAGKQIDATKKSWIELKDPKEHCVVLMGRNKILHHVGLWTCLDRGLVIHSIDNSFVVAQTISTLSRSGWHKIEFYEFPNQ